jgi:hypothetical protein
MAKEGSTIGGLMDTIATLVRSACNTACPSNRWCENSSTSDSSPAA